MTGKRDPVDLDALISRYAPGSFTDSTPLNEAGLVSLSVFRIAAELAPDFAAEIDVEGLAGVHTIADLKRWLTKIVTPDPVVR